MGKGLISRFCRLSPLGLLAGTGILWVGLTGQTFAADSVGVSGIPSQVLQKADESVERALAWLAREQLSSGKFPGRDQGQPAITSLCLLGFLANGYLPGEGPYGNTIDRGIRFVLSCQRPDGLFSYLEPEPYIQYNNTSYCANYNFSIAGLLLSEVYGMTSPDTSGEIRQGVENALKFSYLEQDKPKRTRDQVGGWRYRYPWPPGRIGGYNSDLSVTSWQVMFLRSAKNAGFDVPTKHIEEAMEFVRNCYDPNLGTFLYALYPGSRHVTRAMAGAGIVDLAMGGIHETEMAHNAGKWLLNNDFDRYGYSPGNDRYHYSAFYASLGLYLLGDEYFNPFFPRLARTLIANQSGDGHWRDTDVEGMYGNAYATALLVLALSTHNEILPIFQR